ncbi:hypothetical protein EB796_014465 [Bugula neritina]|uniref:Uncharacterized protein n=1 Tax=Bugula neritina TaxID=10212 RepID=A0A7J7JMG5_BUGNE|nr:hypothetical protein EB796_014465 [Bugula neritina]
MLSWCLQTLHNLFVDLFNIRMQAAKATGVLHSGKLGLYSCRPTRLSHGIRLQMVKELYDLSVCLQDSLPQPR